MEYFWKWTQIFLHLNLHIIFISYLHMLALGLNIMNIWFQVIYANIINIWWSGATTDLISIHLVVVLSKLLHSNIFPLHPDPKGDHFEVPEKMPGGPLNNLLRWPNISRYANRLWSGETLFSKKCILDPSCLRYKIKSIISSSRGWQAKAKPCLWRLAHLCRRADGRSTPRTPPPPADRWWS